jgi:hypothetical protein
VSSSSLSEPGDLCDLLLPPAYSVRAAARSGFSDEESWEGVSVCKRCRSAEWSRYAGRGKGAESVGPALECAIAGL